LQKANEDKIRELQLDLNNIQGGAKGLNFIANNSSLKFQTNSFGYGGSKMGGTVSS
jgi:hypothetical protein